MLHELIRTEYPHVRPLFAGPPFFLTIEAVIAGNTPALLWTDDRAHPATVFMWDTHHGFYLVGDATNSTFNAAVQEWVADHVRRRPFYAKIHYGSAAWEPAVPQIFSSVPLVNAPRRILALGELQPVRRVQRVPSGFRIELIDASFLSRSNIVNLHLVTEEISDCWPSLDRFLVEGFGFCMVRAPEAANGEEVVCWCTAECVSGKTLGIGIETLAAYQGRGFATLTAAWFIQHCIAGGLTPYWDAFQSNGPSLAVARKVGFQRAADYNVLLARTD
jgi:GNAT superfamily N-acetyltransferase